MLYTLVLVIVHPVEFIKFAVAVAPGFPVLNLIKIISHRLKVFVQGLQFMELLALVEVVDNLHPAEHVVQEMPVLQIVAHVPFATAVGSVDQIMMRADLQI